MDNFYDMKSNCLICQKEFYLKLSARKKGRGKYCSKICGIQGQIKRKNVNCWNCNKIFTVIPSKLKLGFGKTCSRVCFINYRLKNRVQVKCRNCKQNFYTSPSLIRRGQGKYCTEICQYKGSQTGFQIICIECKQPFYITPSDQKLGRMFCSKTCTWTSLIVRRKIGVANMGKNSNLWRGGKMSPIMQIRNCFEYHEWHRNVLIRDDYTCQTCGQRGGKLEVNHKIPFIQILSQYSITTLTDAIQCLPMWNLNNGETLCNPCHRMTPTYGARAKYFIPTSCL